jgi:hypothetical protein
MTPGPMREGPLWPRARRGGASSSPASMEVLPRRPHAVHPRPAPGAATRTVNALLALTPSAVALLGGPAFGARQVSCATEEPAVRGPRPAGRAAAMGVAPTRGPASAGRVTPSAVSRATGAFNATRGSRAPTPGAPHSARSGPVRDAAPASACALQGTTRRPAAELGRRARGVRRTTCAWPQGSAAPAPPPCRVRAAPGESAVLVEPAFARTRNAAHRAPTPTSSAEPAVRAKRVEAGLRSASAFAREPARSEIRARGTANALRGPPGGRRA